MGRKGGTSRTWVGIWHDTINYSADIFIATKTIEVHHQRTHLRQVWKGRTRCRQGSSYTTMPQTLEKVNKRARWGTKAVLGFESHHLREALVGSSKRKRIPSSPFHARCDDLLVYTHRMSVCTHRKARSSYTYPLTLHRLPGYNRA